MSDTVDEINAAKDKGLFGEHCEGTRGVTFDDEYYMPGYNCKSKGTINNGVYRYFRNEIGDQCENVTDLFIFIYLSEDGKEYHCGIDLQKKLYDRMSRESAPENATNEEFGRRGKQLYEGMAIHFICDKVDDQKIPQVPPLFIDKNGNKHADIDLPLFLDVYHELKKEENSDQLIEILYTVTQDLALISPLYCSIMQKICNGSRQIILHGAPGTGKTYEVTGLGCYRIDGRRIVFDRERGFVQFHPSYDYTDFVEGLQPAAIGNSDQPTFVRMDGAFKAFCRWVVRQNEEDAHNCNNYYLFVIDEINRADIAKVFGELMYSFEEGNRGEEHAIQTEYRGLPAYEYGDDGRAVRIEDDCFAKGFYIPENVIIIGTMNDIDRSVDAFDYAMQRRFAWIDVNPEQKISDIYDSNNIIADILVDMNGEVDIDTVSFVKTYFDGKSDIFDKTAMEIALGNMEKEPALAIRAADLNAAISKAIDKAGRKGKDYVLGQAYYKNYDESEYSPAKYFDIYLRPILESYKREIRNLDIDALREAFTRYVPQNSDIDDTPEA